MPVTPSLIERLLFRAGVAPRPLVDIAAAASFRALQAAMRLGLFELLARGPRTAGSLADEVDADPATLEALLELLVAARHLDRRGAMYRNAAPTTRWLVSGRKGSIAAFVRVWTEVVFDEWDALETSLRTGRPAPHMHEWLTARKAWPLFNAAMTEFAASAADEVASAIDLPRDARSLIDIGGGHGLYALAFCRRHRELQATVFDLPIALDAARGNVAGAGLADRVTLRSGDVTRDDLGSSYDVALLFQLVHYFDDESLEILLRRVVAALRPGGTALILDQMTPAPPTPAARAFLRTLALQYKVSLGGRLRPYDHLERLLVSCGFKSVERRRILRLPENEIAIARKGGHASPLAGPNEGRSDRRCVATDGGAAESDPPRRR